ncbi:hypothetical protein CU669_03910 [Paramagnetospirillum kuznetsovii]|uniref:Uncharacterized protein n=1 Tax=Paramagnetospirillum kuznetsovii TaxID=2053833 RepID=A0A364P1S9_9PROT|nr:hypothetical protein [Paramagnetospirillum kuznetsovii]RAU23299.1 hypothetical protein CU669_03910 [Paramagnetospirillum kuznetsovii]
MSDGNPHDCLDQRIPRIHGLIGDQALFQAGAMIKGGSRCAALRTCERWNDCACTHGQLWEHLSALLSNSR